MNKAATLIAALCVAVAMTGCGTKKGFWSPNLDAWIALALLASGRARHGETLWAVSPLADANVRVQVGPPCFIDPDGERLRV